MKKANLIPLALFCLVFLAYSIYFVKVINTTNDLEPNSIAKTVKRVIEERSAMEETEKANDEVTLKSESLLKEPITRYVNYTWLNIRKEPSLSSAVVEKIVKNDQVQVLGYPSSSWAYIKTNAGSKGYVARRYLSDKPLAQDAPATISAAPKTEVVPEPIVSLPDGAPVIFDVPVITYHHISNDTKSYSASLVLPEINFNAQLDYLVGHGFKSYTFFDLKAIAAGQMKEEEKSVIITFNGGYADAYTAAQHLNGKGLKGVFFITSDKIGTEGYLDWRQVKKMRSWGMEIGSQGVNGANLLSSGEFYIKDEIYRSKDIIEKELGEKIISFAYPFGGYTQSIADIAEEAGYVFARTNDSGSRYSDKQFFKIPTLRVFFPAGANQFRAWLGE